MVAAISVLVIVGLSVTMNSFADFVGPTWTPQWSPYVCQVSGSWKRNGEPRVLLEKRKLEIEGEFDRTIEHYSFSDRIVEVAVFISQIDGYASSYLYVTLLEDNEENRRAITNLEKEKVFAWARLPDESKLYYDSNSFTVPLGVELPPAYGLSTCFGPGCPIPSNVVTEKIRTETLLVEAYCRRQ